MGVEILVHTSDEADLEEIQFDDYQVVDVLGKKEKDFALKIDELYSEVIESVGKSLKHESELTIEITGSINLKANAGAKWLLFKVGGSAEKTNSMTITLKTKIKPSVDIL